MNTGDLVPFILIGFGLILLLAGRQLFWLFVGVAGFVIGFQVGMQAFDNSEYAIGAGLVIGLIGCLLAIVLQKVAVALGGAAAGWVLGERLAVSLGGGSTGALLCSLILAVLFAVAVLMLFDVALIVISSFTGASLILDPLVPGGSTLWLILWVIAVAVGIAVQFGLRSRAAAPAT